MFDNILQDILFIFASFVAIAISTSARHTKQIQFAVINVAVLLHTWHIQETPMHLNGTCRYAFVSQFFFATYMYIK